MPALLVFDGRALAALLPVSGQVHAVVEQAVDTGLVVDDFIEKEMAGVPPRTRDGVGEGVGIDLGTGLSGVGVVGDRVEREADQRSVVPRLSRRRKASW